MNYILDATNEQDKEIWLTLKILRGHMEDVYDLSWAPDSLSLISGSVDNTAMIWSIETGKSKGILTDHKGFVQGVAWDPANKYFATLSTDRNLRVFDALTRRVVSRSNKSLLPVPETSNMHGKITRLYHDDTLQTFFRRFSFSPDGELIVTPSGICDQESQNVDAKPLNVSYIYTRQSLKQPVALLPSPDHTMCVKFCPLFFQLREFNEELNPPLIPLPYRMVFAVATKSSVFLYDTQQTLPFGVISNIHYTRLTDLTWSSDGRVLIVSSTDGFCSLVTFGEKELGEIYDDTAIKENLKASAVVKSNKQLKKRRKKKATDSADNPPTCDSPPKEILTNLPAVVLKDTEILSKIIKSDERFSPQKKDRPVTPIAIRRHPRSVDSEASGGEDVLKPKTPTPIAIRRQPRTLIPDVESSTATEEAVDAWPIGTEKPSAVADKSIEKMVCDGDMGATADIRLVLEADSQDEAMETEEVPKEETKKTPRRVPLITLSTPKSKKK